MKLILDTNALKALLATDPGIEVELRSLAREHVADAIKRQALQVGVRDAIEARISEMLERRGTVKKPEPSLVGGRLLAMAEEAMKSAIGKGDEGIANLVLQRLEARIEDVISTRNLEARIDAIIMQRMSVLLKGFGS
jgi:hypothetical protein